MYCIMHVDLDLIPQLSNGCSRICLQQINRSVCSCKYGDQRKTYRMWEYNGWAKLEFTALTQARNREEDMKTTDENEDNEILRSFSRPTYNTYPLRCKMSKAANWKTRLDKPIYHLGAHSCREHKTKITQFAVVLTGVLRKISVCGSVHVIC